MKKLHVVTFDIPSPPNYGGIIDIYYRLEALKELGVYIILHCFYKEQVDNLDLTTISDEVYFYKRKMSWLSQISTLPFITKSRTSKELNNRLKKDNFPILLEGHHCCSVLLDKKITNSRISVRIHNIETEYYLALAKNERFLLNKMYFYFESFKLKRFDKLLKQANYLFCLSFKDTHYYKNINKKTLYWNIGVELKNEFVTKSNIIESVIFHGNLSVNENEIALLNLIEIWEKQNIQIPLNIYGKKPTKKLIERIKQLENIKLFPNPSHEELFEAILHSKFNISYTLQQTGMKIKLIHNLLHGNICLANDKMVGDTDVTQFVTIFDESNLKRLLETLDLDFNKIQKRKEKIAEIYHPQTVAQPLLKLIFEK